MWSRCWPVAMLFAVLIAAGGCSSSVPRADPTSSLAGGTVVGTLQLRGGPAPGTERGVSGEVYVFTSPDLVGTPTATVKANADGRFSLDLSSGTYYLAASSPSFGIEPPPATPPCHGDKPAVVSAGSTSRVDIACELN